MWQRIWVALGSPLLGGLCTLARTASVILSHRSEVRYLLDPLLNALDVNCHPAHPKGMPQPQLPAPMPYPVAQLAL